MSVRTDITVELGASAAMLSSLAPHGISVAEQIRAASQDWLDALNLPTEASVRLIHVERSRGPRFVDFAVVLNGDRCGFSRRQLARSYEATTHRELAEDTSVVNAARALLANAFEGDREDLVLGQALLAEIAVEAVKTSAERVVTPEVTEALLSRAREESTPPRPSIREIDRHLATDVLRRLAGVHVAVQDAPAFAASLLAGQVDGLTNAEIAEQLIDLWRPRAIEIHVDPRLAKKLLNDEPELRTAYPASALSEEVSSRLGMMCDGLFFELGIFFSHVSVLADPALPPGYCRFRWHHRQSPLLRGLAEDELLVETYGQQETFTIPGARPRSNPANGRSCVVISRSFEQELPSHSTTWNEWGYVILLLSAELRSAAPMLLSLGDVKDTLGKLSERFPTATAATVHEFSALQIAQVLRWLLRDDVSIRDLRGVLETMLNFSYTSGVRSPTAGWGGREPYVYVGDAGFMDEPYFSDDDPYMARFDMDTMQVFAEPMPEWIANGRMHAEFVKFGMRHVLTDKLGRGRDVIICYLVDAEIEKRLLDFLAAPNAGAPPLSEQEQDDFLEGIAESFGEYPGSEILFLATTPDVALLMQDMISLDFPEATILHRQSVAEHANVQAIGRVHRSPKVGPPLRSDSQSH